MQVKGNSLRGVVAATRRLYGQPILDQALALLPIELARRAQRDGIITGNWYPVDDLRQLDHAVMNAVGGGPEVVRQVAREATLEDFRGGLYQVLTFVLSPEFVIKRTPGIWKRYYDGGIIHVAARSGQAEASFRGCTGFDPVMWQGVIGGCSGVLEACGAKGLEIQIVDGGGHDDWLAIKASWR